MNSLKVRMEISGSSIFVGEIFYKSSEDAVFQYAEEYLNLSISVPISISLPLQSNSFTPMQTKNFFEGLLPEGFTRRAVAQWLRVDESDYLSILKGLGSECLGAIQIIDEDYQENSSYEKLTLDEVKALANEGAVKSAAIMTETHLSLAGAS